MFRPEAHAHPAELVLAFPAGHVVTAAILFYRRVALRAFFRVGRDPIRRFRVVFAFLQPLLHEGTGWRLMICKSASEAEAVFAATMNSGRNYCQLSLLDATLDGIYTFRCWTPFQVVLVIDVGSSKKHLVPIAW
jgi:hypothetical protein